MEENKDNSPLEGKESKPVENRGYFTYYGQPVYTVIKEKPTTLLSEGKEAEHQPMSKEDILLCYAELKPVLNKPGVFDIVLKAMEEYRQQHSVSKEKLHTESEGKETVELEQVAKEFASKNMFRSDMWVDQYFIAGAQWQSQHTAKEVEALRFDNNIQHDAAMYWLNDSTNKAKEIEAKDKRIAKLEAALTQIHEFTDAPEISAFEIWKIANDALELTPNNHRN